MNEDIDRHTDHVIQMTLDDLKSAYVPRSNDYDPKEDDRVNLMTEEARTRLLSQFEIYKTTEFEQEVNQRIAEDSKEIQQKVLNQIANWINAISSFTSQFLENAESSGLLRKLEKEWSQEQIDERINMGEGISNEECAAIQEGVHIGKRRSQEKITSSLQLYQADVQAIREGRLDDVSDRSKVFLSADYQIDAYAQLRAEIENSILRDMVSKLIKEVS